MFNLILTIGQTTETITGLPYGEVLDRMAFYLELYPDAIAKIEPAF